MHKLLQPSLLNVRSVFENEFVGMSRIPVSYAELEVTRAEVIRVIRSELTDLERRFLISVKEGTPDWSLLSVFNIQRLPGIQWKLHNIQRMSRDRHREQLEKLRRCLSL